MNESLNTFRDQLSDTVLTFVWQQWSSIGVMAAAVSPLNRVIDPEPLLLLTLEVARQDPRMFDEVLDWLIVNGKWINVVRLSTIFAEDHLCSPEVLGAVAATLAEHDKTPKWRTLARRLKPKKSKATDALFHKHGTSLVLPGSSVDETFRGYGLLRSPLQLRGMSSPVLPSVVPSWTAGNFLFKSRALFGVSIRADVFAYLVLQGASNPTRIARELGYSQRRVQDALSDLAAAGVFKVRTNGKAREYLLDRDSVLQFLGAGETDVAWFNWRALCRALVTQWRRAFALREVGLTPYVLESEKADILREVSDDLLKASHPSTSPVRTEQPAIRRSRDLLAVVQDTLAFSSGYRWKRFWQPRGGASAGTEAGHLVIHQTDKTDFESIAHVPCLVLLGQPGMGKSFEMKAAVKLLTGPSARPDVKVHFLDLRSYGSEERLIRDLFESETFRGWARGEWSLHLFLDSLDEAVMHQGTIANVLVDQFQQYPSLKGLFLRIACRTAEWPSALETGLKSKWEAETFKAVELVPLTRADIVEAAASNAIDSDDFLREVDKREALPLASKPVTLKFLLKSFQQAGQLSSNQKDLFHEGCRRLCEEANESRIGARLTGKLTADQRMDVAGRIAAVSIFCDRNVIRIGPSTGVALEAGLTVDELCSVAGDDGRPLASRDEVLEALSTALFSSRGPELLGFDHRTYAEFLAAGHLNRRELDPAQMLQLLRNPGDPERKVVPQLHGTAAWLATMDNRIFRELMKSDPEVMLQSDVTTAAPEDRRKLVEALLGQAEEESSWDAEGSFHDHYWKLEHPGLSEQLRDVVLDSSKGKIIRCEAIGIAEKCNLTRLTAELVLVALDPDEPSPVRVEAARFVARVGEPALKARLKPLLNLPEASDPNDELRGCALQACWPDFMTAEELFHALTSRRNPNRSGEFQRFLGRKFVEELSPADLPTCLQWVTKQNLGLLPRILGRVKLREIMERASANFDQPGVIEEFARTLFTGLKNNIIFFTVQDGYSAAPIEWAAWLKPAAWVERLASNESLRHRVIQMILPEMQEPDVDGYLLTGKSSSLVQPLDVPWLIACLEEEQIVLRQEALAHLICCVWNVENPSQRDAVIRLSKGSESLKRIFASRLRQLFPPKDGASSATAGAAIRADTGGTNLQLSQHERVAKSLERIETDRDLDQWCHLVFELFQVDLHSPYRPFPPMDLTTSPGWRSADRPSRNRILAAAQEYLLEHDANPQAWPEGPPWYRPATAGFQALRLLQAEAPDKLQLPTRVWEGWVPIILSLPDHCVEGSSDLVPLAYRNAPDGTIRWLRQMIDWAHEGKGNLSIIRHLSAVWDERLGKALLEAADVQQRATSMVPLVDALLAHHVPGAEQFAYRLLQAGPSGADNARSNAIFAAIGLLKHYDGAWPVVWSAMLQDPSFGKSLWLQAAEFHRTPGEIVDTLTPDQIADLYVWLIGQYPGEESPGERRALINSECEVESIFRGGLVDHMRVLGTRAACEAIERLVRQFPSNQWLKTSLAQAKAETRKKLWQPPTPAELFGLLSRRDQRFLE